MFSCVIMICSGRFCATGCGGSKPPPYDNFVFTIFVGLDAHIEPYNPSVSCADSAGSVVATPPGVDGGIDEGLIEQGTVPCFTLF